MFRFETLDVWRLAADFVSEVYLLTKLWPKSELFSLTAQIWRSAVSIPANIAEGSAAATIKDNKNYLDYARKSLFETASHFLIAEKQGYLKERERHHLYEKADMLSRKLVSFKRSLR